MPTLIGRFNELLHQLSSSSTTTAQQQQHSSTSPTARQALPSSAVPSRTSVARTHQQKSGSSVHRHASLSAVDRPSPIRQSQPLQQRSSNAAKPTPLGNSGGGSTSRSRSSSGSRPTTVKSGVEEYAVDGAHHHRSSRSHRSSREGSSSSHNHQKPSQQHHSQRQSNHHQTSSSSSSSRRDHSSSRRDSTPSSSATRRSSHQQLTGSSRRRHSIASVSSANGGQSTAPATSTSEHRSKKPPTSSSSTNAMASRNSNSKKSSTVTTATINNVHTNVEHNNNNNNVPSKTNVMMRRKGSAGETAAAPTATNGESGEETLASKFARKMKISGITRKGSNCTASTATNTQTSATSKVSSTTSSSQKAADKAAAKQAKQQLKQQQQQNSRNAKKKSAEAEMAAEEAAKGCFIYRYLNGHLVKQHPEIVSGKTCYDLPVKDIETLATGVVASCTGPSGGLATVNCTPPKPFDLAADLEVDFIDEDYPTDSSLSSTGAGDLLPPHPKSPKCSNSTASTVSSDVGDETPPPSSSENASPVNGGGMGAYSSLESDNCNPIAGINDWSREKDFAYGISTSLYESQLLQNGSSTQRNAGDPIADSFAVVVRENSSIIALADGVNWGEKAALASRCAVYGCMDYLNRALYSPADSTRIRNTLDIYVALLRSFNAAHDLILAQGGHLTTLCAAVICQLKNSDRFIVCTCNVGDSLAYVYSPVYGVREITLESHDIFSNRDMRDALGALGPVSGNEPELNNLTVAMTVVDVGDIVFLTSDGISDNFDPVVGKFAMPKKEATVVGEKGALAPEALPEKSTVKAKAAETAKATKARKSVQRSNSNPERSQLSRHKPPLNPDNYTAKGLPLVSAKQRHELTLLRMEDLIMNGVNSISLYSRGQKRTAKELCKLMVEFPTKLTMAKRRILEDPDLYDETEEELHGAEAYGRQRQRRRQVGAKLMQMPGKLDHASIAAIEIGFFGSVAAKRASLIMPTFTTTNFTSRRSTATNGNSKHQHNSHQPSQNQSQHNNSSHKPPSAPLSVQESHEDHDDPRFNLKMKATLARFESQDFLECCCESGPI